MRGPLFLGGLLVCFLGCAVATRADDRSRGVALPGLLAAPPGSVRATAASVDLRGDDVTLRLSLQDTANETALLIQGPRFTSLGEAEPYFDRQFPELRATIDGTSLAIEGGFGAFVGERDITADVRQAALDPFVIATSPPFVDPPGGAGSSAFERLVNQHAVERSDGQFLARWTAQRLFRFKLSDAPHPVFSLFYKARPGFDLFELNNLSSFVQLTSYCVTIPQLRKQLATGDQPPRQIVARAYAIAVGIDGQPPPHVSALVTERNAVFCGAEGRPVFGGSGDAPAPARADKGGVLRVLRLDSP
jgi:hypothetical protein